MVKKLGIELEAWACSEFCYDTGAMRHAEVPASIKQADACGYLYEFRGQPRADVVEAIYSVEADLHRAHRIECDTKPMIFFDSDYRKVPSKLKEEIARKRGVYKQPNRVQNLYPNLPAYLPSSINHIGMHLHFSDLRNDGTIATVLDISKIIKTLDSAFEEEIKRARRVPGLYTMRTYGFEYRSLPSSVYFNQSKLEQVINSVFFNT